MLIDLIGAAQRWSHWSLSLTSIVVGDKLCPTHPLKNKARRVSS